MCSAYWNLKAEVTCPSCGWTGEDAIQTHFMGEPGSCVAYYALGEQVEELGDISVTLGHDSDNFTAACLSCHTFWDLGARIENGRVIEVWNLEKPDGD